MTDNNQKPNNVYSILSQPEIYCLVPYRPPEPEKPEVKASFHALLVQKIHEASGPDNERKD